MGGRTKPGKGKWLPAMSLQVVLFLTNNSLPVENGGENSTIRDLFTSKAFLLQAKKRIKKN